MLFIALALTCGLLIACGGADDRANAPAPSLIGSYDDPHDFRPFARKLDDALAAADLQFFLDNVSFHDVSCAEESPRPPASCAGMPPEATVQGILVGVWEGEDFYLDEAGYEQFIRDFLTQFAAGEGDGYGEPEPRLYAYAIIRPEFRVAPAAVETIEAIVMRIPLGNSDPAREVLLVTLGFNGERWAVSQLVLGPATFLDSAGPKPPGESGAETIFDFWASWED